ncbi:MAG TPA: ABC transporter permease subunit [Frankiaceae bacterium]|nr:ABC transporter permease subunit [Frankiaceae bacterium]
MGPDPSGPSADGAAGTLASLATASWGQRAYAQLIDCALLAVGEGIAIGLIAVAGLHGIGGLILQIALLVVPALLYAWQAVVRQAAVGQTIGKARAGISLVDDADGLSPTEATCLRRLLAHLVDLVSLVGFFRPLWNAERKTFADTICKTRVIDGVPVPPPPGELKTVPLRHPGRWVATALVFIGVGMLVHSVATNPNFHWDVVGKNLFKQVIFEGILRTLELTVIAMVIGIALGIVLAVMRLSPNPIVSSASWIYIWVFRGTPVYVQLLFWNAVGVLYKHLAFGVPFGRHFFSGSSNTIITTFTAAILGLGLNEGAYMSEIVRAGIISVDQGQTEAAQALGMNRMRIMRRIVLPQAMRVIIPPTGNETISMLKTTSLVSVISIQELLGAAQSIYDTTLQILQLLIVASLWYLLFTSVLSVGQYYLERRYTRGSARELPPTPWQRLRRSLTTFHAPEATGPLQ